MAIAEGGIGTLLVEQWVHTFSIRWSGRDSKCKTKRVRGFGSEGVEFFQSNQVGGIGLGGVDGFPTGSSGIISGGVGGNLDSKAF